MFENISIKEAMRLIMEGKAMLFDLREKEAYQKDHVPYAVWVGEQNLEQYMKIRPDLLKILYCDFGNQSMLAARMLDEKGYPAASIVGGYRAYEEYIGRRNDLV